jgi:hypothetical protein
MKNPNLVFPINVTGQLYDNRIDCGKLGTKKTWEIVVTRSIPLDLHSGKIIQMNSYLTLTSAGNFGPPYFI